MKKNRQEKLLELVSMYEIDTQEELISRLENCGYNATQATISRDMRELKISKISTGRGSYRYVAPKQLVQDDDGSFFNAAVMSSVSGVVCSGNLVILKTTPGLANAVAVGVEEMKIPEILGCVAGDDTIFIATPGETCSIEISEKIKKMLRKA